MAGLKSSLIGIMVILLFAICILFFAQSFIYVNNPSAGILNTNFINSSQSSLNQSINSFINTINKSQSNLALAKPSPVSFLFLIFTEAFSIPISFLSVGISGINTVITMIFLQLGGNSALVPLFMVFSLVTSIITAIIVWQIIKSIRTGEFEH